VRAKTYSCGEYRLDVAERNFSRGEEVIALEPRVFAVIAELLAKSGSLVTRDELLDAVWGHRYVTPSTLNRTIALARRAFGDDIAKPRYIQTVHGSGYRYIGPIEAPASGSPPRPAEFGPPPTLRLPARIDTLVGRETELTAVAGLLAEKRAVTLVGAGGMGKTQCALEAARRATGSFPDGVWFFDLAPLQRAEEWLRAFGAALALPASAPEALQSALCALLAERQALLVLDNCERIAGPLGALVAQLLRSTAALKVLATSQLPLDFYGEHLLRLPPLELPAESAIETGDPKALARFAAVDMIVRRIRAVQPEFELRPENARHVARICVRLDGMPLALELAAARFSLLSAEQVHERLVQRFRFLGSNSAGRDLRHRSLQTLLEWSYGLLSTEEEQLLNWCAIFVQTWSAEAVISVAGGLGYDAERTIDLLSGLVDRSMVGLAPAVTPTRYRLLETVREHALARLRSSGREAEARAAHVRAVVVMCRTAQADMLAGRMRERVEQLAQEIGNIAAAIDTSMRTAGRHAEALDILGSLLLFTKAHGEYITVRLWCQEVLSHCEPADTPERARALLTHGVIQMHVNATGERSESVLPEAARIAALHDDAWTEGYAHGYYTLALANWGWPDEAQAHLAITEARARRCGDATLAGLAGLARGWVRLARGEVQAALDELLAARDVGADLHQRHFIDMYLALSQFALGNSAAAANGWFRGMELSIAVGNVRGIAGSVEGCAYLACRAGDCRSAARLLAAARIARERTGIPIFNFWRPHQESTQAMIRSSLSPDELVAETMRGERMRQEDAANEAQALLWRLSGNGERRSAQRTTNVPSGS
jgi:predicted ATPase/DNA-binding winged helix-turn-helix (wHTH) protein